MAVLIFLFMVIVFVVFMNIVIRLVWGKWL